MFENRNCLRYEHHPITELKPVRDTQYNCRLQSPLCRAFPNLLHLRQRVVPARLFPTAVGAEQDFRRVGSFPQEHLAYFAVSYPSYCAGMRLNLLMNNWVGLESLDEGGTQHPTNFRPNLTRTGCRAPLAAMIPVK